MQCSVCFLCVLCTILLIIEIDKICFVFIMIMYIFLSVGRPYITQQVMNEISIVLLSSPGFLNCVAHENLYVIQLCLFLNKYFTQNTLYFDK